MWWDEGDEEVVRRGGKCCWDGEWMMVEEIGGRRSIILLCKAW